MIPLNVKENEIETKCQEKGLAFLGWKEPYINVNSKIKLLCPKHGEWCPTYWSFIKLMSGCPGCANVQRKTVGTVEKEIKQKCEEHSYEFINWLNDYKNCESKFKYKCQLHGEQETTVYRFLKTNKKCPKCRNQKLSEKFRSPLEDVEQNINRLTRDTNYKFVRWYDSYVNQYSKFVCNCRNHGDWVVSVSSFVNNGSRCPSCARYGFDPSSTGYLYAIRSTDGRFIKIGISNYPTKRLKQLRRATPFDFVLVEKIKGTGVNIANLELTFHRKFDSAEFTGFDRATEWLKWTPEIQYWLRLLSS